MNSADVSEKLPADIIIAGSSRFSVAVYEQLCESPQNTVFLRRAPYEAESCKTLWLEISSLSHDWDRLFQIDCERLVLSVEEMPINHLKQVISRVQAHPQSNQLWLSQNASLRGVLTQHLPRERVCPTPLFFPQKSPSPAKVPTEKFQLGIHLSKTPDSFQKEFIGSFIESPDINIRLFEDQPMDTAYLHDLPGHWSRYAANQLSLEKFAMLCDGISFFEPSDLDQNVVKSAQSGALPLVNANVACRAPEAQKLSRPFKDAEEIKNFVRDSLDTRDTLQHGLKAEARRLVSQERFLETLSSITELDISPSSITEPKQTPASPVLFVSTNGIGLGHVTRLLAVARRCPSSIAPVFAVFSAGVRLVEEAGYPCEHMVSNEFAEVDPMGWHEHVRAELRAIMRQFNPVCIVYDGNTMYPGVTQAISDANLPLLWIRRGLYRDNTTHASLQSQVYADLLCQPGELAGAYDKGPTADRTVQNNWPRRFVDVNPVTWVSPDKVLSKTDARKSLGIAQDGLAVLIQVGAGNLKDTDRLIERIAGKLNASAKLNIYLAQWPIADRPNLSHEGVTPLKRYPMSPCLKAFDFVISATGYNSFHELMLLGIPSLFIPNEFTRLDDQIARAQYAADKKSALLAFSERARDLEAAIDEILKPEVRNQLSENTKAHPWQDGAQDIVDWVCALAGKGEWPQ